MAINLTITVPEKLHKRLQEVKKSFNVSRVCQEAIETEIKRHELLKSGLEDIKDVIERLRLEKAEIAKRAYDIGYQQGLEDFKSLPYEALIIVDSHRDPWDALGEFDEKGVECYSFFHHYLYLDDNCDDFNILVNGEWIDRDLFIEGYFQAILDCYDKIKDQL